MASRLRWTIGAVSLVACALCATTPARAQTAADRETARSLMEQGHDLYDKKNFKEALKRFKAANDIMHVPSTALWTAKAQAALGELVAARDTIAAMRRMPEKPNDPKPFKQARADAIDLDDTLAPRVPALTLVLKGAPAGDSATVTIDGVATGDPSASETAAEDALAEAVAELDAAGVVEESPAAAGASEGPGFVRLARTATAAAAATSASPATTANVLPPRAGRTSGAGSDSMVGTAMAAEPASVCPVVPLLDFSDSGAPPDAVTIRAPVPDADGVPALVVSALRCSTSASCARSSAALSPRVIDSRRFSARSPIRSAMNAATCAAVVTRFASTIAFSSACCSSAAVA